MPPALEDVMLNVLFTATRAACEVNEDCTILAVGNHEQYMEFQRGASGVKVELGRFEESPCRQASVERVHLDPKRIELLLSADASSQLGTEQRVHIPLRLTEQEACLVRDLLGEISADLLAFEGALYR